MSAELKFIFLCFSVFLAFLCMGISLPILPEFVNHTLGFSMTMAGLSVGIQSLSTVISRKYAGRSADMIGAKLTVQRGFIACVISSLLYLCTSYSLAISSLSISFLFLARALLGIGESLILTGVLTWGIELLGQSSSGKVMSWNGMAMYSAIAIGAPLGLFLFENYHFQGIAIAFSVLSLIGLLISSIFSYQPVEKSVLKPSFTKTVKTIWVYGLGYALGGVGFGAISAFVAILFNSKGWGSVEWALICFGASYILVRLFLGHLPDLKGGRKVAIVSSLIELSGLLLLWSANRSETAFIAICLTGAGFSLLFPSFGVEALKKVDPQAKGTALGAFSSFFDITLGMTGPICGLIITHGSVQTIYLFGAITSLIVFFIALRLKRETLF